MKVGQQLKEETVQINREEVDLSKMNQQKKFPAELGSTLISKTNKSEKEEKNSITGDGKKKVVRTPEKRQKMTSDHRIDRTFKFIYA